MFVEAHELQDRCGRPTWDLCIVGAGVAGLSLAKGLADQGLRVLLLESGGLEGREDAARLLRGTSNRDDYPFVASRARAFGGTSTVWSGACIPLDPVDFIKRSWVPLSGWPITAGELQPYYAPAAEVFGHPEWTEDAPRLAASPLNTGALQMKPVFTSTPLDVSLAMREWIGKSADIACCLGANATGLASAEEGSKIAGVIFHDRAGQRHEANARVVVLATGGIEAPRLLLATDQSAPSGIGEVRRATGRGYMDHPLVSVGILPIGARRRELLFLTDGRVRSGVRTFGTIGLSAETRETHGLLDLHLRAYRYSRFEDRAEIVGLKESALAGPVQGFGKLMARYGPRALPVFAAYGAWHLWNKSSTGAWFDHVRFLAFAEQEPDFGNCITLGEEVDRYGLPLPHLHLSESEFFFDGLQRSCEALAAAFASKGFPGARMGLEPACHIASYGGYGLHHMGATRMSETARTGTVNRDCRVHGTANLYVVGSSVFPTGGAANPTFAISALAFRLADHLSRNLKAT